MITCLDETLPPLLAQTAGTTLVREWMLADGQKSNSVLRCCARSPQPMSGVFTVLPVFPCLVRTVPGRNYSTLK